MNRGILEVGDEVWAEGYDNAQKILALKSNFVVLQDVETNEQGSQIYEKIKPVGLLGPGPQGVIPQVKDQVVAPQHYADRKFQTILVMEDTLSEEQFKGYLKGNVIKYISRAGKKDKTLQELNKAKTYLQWLIEMEEHGQLQNVPEYK
jgi:hypothetical protein